MTRPAGETAAEVVTRLDLQPHPEGGWFRETWREPSPDGGRGRATAILYLLDRGGRSHWRVDAAELWLWHAGAPLLLSVHAAATTTHRLCAKAPQALVPAHAWQAARTDDGWALMSCVVTPAFDFAGFELAPPGWEPNRPLRRPPAAGSVRLGRDDDAR